MNLKRAIMTLCFIIMFALYGGMNTYAMATGFETEDMNEKEQKSFLQNVQLSLLKSDDIENSISCFDVSDKGLIALGCDDSSNKKICVYSADGKFEYGYSFTSSGDFGVQWENDDLLIYFVRSDVAMLVNKNALCLDIRNISNTIENNTYWNHTVFTAKRIVGENKYEMKNDFGVLNVFATSYSQLIKTDKDGKVTTLYDATSSQIIKLVVILCGTGVFILIVIIVLINQFKRLKYAK